MKEHQHCQLTTSGPVRYRRAANLCCVSFPWVSCRHDKTGSRQTGDSELAERATGDLWDRSCPACDFFMTPLPDTPTLALHRAMFPVIFLIWRYTCIPHLPAVSIIFPSNTIWSQKTLQLVFHLGGECQKNMQQDQGRSGHGYSERDGENTILEADNQPTLTSSTLVMRVFLAEGLNLDWGLSHTTDYQEPHAAFQKDCLHRHCAINPPSVSLVLYLAFLVAFSIF